MKNLISIIEKLKVGSKTKVSGSSAELLVDLLIKYLLKDQNIKKSDFESWEDTVYGNIYTLCNVPQDYKYFKQFYNDIIKYEEDFMFNGKPIDNDDNYFRIGLKDDIYSFIKFDLYSSGINSIDISENIMKLILDKIK